MKKILIPITLLFSIISASAKTIKDEETWVNINSYINLNEKWQLYLEYQPRFFDYNRYNGAVLHRGAIGRNVGHGFSAWVGYAMITWNERAHSKFPAKSHHEDRPFLMLIHNKDFTENFKLTNRTRFEDRIFRHTDEGSKRFRHMIRGQYKFNHSAWGLAVWNEWFWNANTIKPSRESRAPVTKEGFDQNRAFAGVVYLFGEKEQHMIETGYMNNYVNGATNDRNASVWMTTITAKF